MQADVVVSWFAGVPQSAQTAFKRPTKFIALPIPPGRKYAAAVQELGQNPIANAIKKYASGTEPLRVAVMGFSEGCAGVAQLLASADGGRVDSVLAIDGIHTGYANGNQVNPPSMKSWFEFAKLAVVNERLFVDSYSSVVPPGYASTTETADWLWKNLNLELGGEQIYPLLPPLVAPPTTIHVSGGPATGKTRDVEYPVIPWKQQRRANGLILLGCKNNDPPGTADHIYQARVMMPVVVINLLAARWNELDPADPSQTAST